MAEIVGLAERDLKIYGGQSEELLKPDQGEKEIMFFRRGLIDDLLSPGLPRCGNKAGLLATIVRFLGRTVSFYDFELAQFQALKFHRIQG